MKSFRILLLAGLTYAAAVVVRAGDVGSALFRARIIGGAHYIQSESLVTDDGETEFSWVDARSGRACVAFLRYTGPQGELDSWVAFRHFDGWGRPVHPNVIADIEESYFSQDPQVIVRDILTIVGWREEGEMRVFTESGEPISDTFLAFDPAFVCLDTFRLTDDSQIVAIAFNWDPPRGLCVRALDMAGNPLTNAVLIAPIPAIGGIEYIRACVTSDGGALIAYDRWANQVATHRPWVQKLNADMSAAPAVQWASAQGLILSIAALADGRYAVVLDGDTFAFVQECNLSGQPVGAPTPIQPNVQTAGMAADGRFAVIYDDQRNHRVLGRLYNAAWQQIGQDFVIPFGDVEYWTVFERQGVAYDDNGSVWFLYEERQTPGREFISMMRPYLPGDLNFDGTVNNFDIDSFVAALTDPAAYEAQYGIPGDVGVILGDVNFDGTLNNFDIDPFVACLTGGCP